MRTADTARDQPLLQPIRTGYLKKLGCWHRVWRKRYFVVRADYRVDYYKTEEVRAALAAARHVWRAPELSDARIAL